MGRSVIIWAYKSRGPRKRKSFRALAFSQSLSIQITSIRPTPSTVIPATVRLNYILSSGGAVEKYGWQRRRVGNAKGCKDCEVFVEVNGRGGVRASRHSQVPWTVVSIRRRCINRRTSLFRARGKIRNRLWRCQACDSIQD